MIDTSHMETHAKALRKELIERQELIRLQHFMIEYLREELRQEEENIADAKLFNEAQHAQN